MSEPILIGTVKSGRRVEICRSFARKLNLANHGGPAYEAVDFFSSRKMECDESEAAEVSARLVAECEAEVMAAAREYIAKMKAAQRKTAASEAA